MHAEPGPEYEPERATPKKKALDPIVEEEEDDDQEECQMPSPNNPYGNVMLTDYADRPDRPKACDPLKVKEESDDIFYENLFRDTTDLYEQNNSKRQFYTMPNTKIPNDQTAFARSCFGESGKLKALGQRYFSP